MDTTPPSGQPTNPEAARPGDTIAPATPVAASASVGAVPAAQVSPIQASPATQPVTQAAPAEQTVPAIGTQSVAPDGDGISWTAAEFIAHNKSLGWYGLLAGAVIVLAAIVFLLTKDKISTSVVVIAGLALGAYGARQPQQRRYILDEQGLSIGDKYLPFSLFRSFSVVDEGHVSSISFFPLKRFGQLTTIYYNPEDEADIIELLADRLPMDDRGHDVIDRFMKRIRF